MDKGHLWKPTINSIVNNERLGSDSMHILKYNIPVRAFVISKDLYLCFLADYMKGKQKPLRIFY